MRKRYLLFLSLLIAGFLILSGYAVVKAQQRPSAGSGSNWSNPATWPDKTVPGKDAEVTIDLKMSYDVNGVVQVEAAQRDTGHALTMTVETVPPDLSWLGRPLIRR